MPTCEGCGKPLSKARLRAMPSATFCVQCVSDGGDVEKTRGCMVWNHKTAPELYIGPKVDELLRYQRRGVHAQLPLGNPKDPRLAQAVENERAERDACEAVREEAKEGKEKSNV